MASRLVFGSHFCKDTEADLQARETVIAVAADHQVTVLYRCGELLANQGHVIFSYMLMLVNILC